MYYELDWFNLLSQVTTLRKSTKAGASRKELKMKTCSLSGSDAMNRSSSLSMFPIPTVYTCTPASFRAGAAYSIGYWLDLPSASSL